jgi:hypothetical protein
MRLGSESTKLALEFFGSGYAGLGRSWSEMIKIEGGRAVFYALS